MAGVERSAFGALDGATPIFTGALDPRFFHDDYAGAWMAIYSTPESNEVDYRTAPALTGPWSDGAQLFVATVSQPDLRRLRPARLLRGWRSHRLRGIRRLTSEFGSDTVLERVVFAR